MLYMLGRCNSTYCICWVEVSQQVLSAVYVEISQHAVSAGVEVSQHAVSAEVEVSQHVVHICWVEVSQHIVSDGWM